MKIHLRIQGINPEPWTAPEGSVGRARGKLFVQFHKNGQLRTYQDAVHEAVEKSLPDGFIPTTELLQVEFRFWRQLPTYLRGGKKVRKKWCDATNMQKALEDALQGVLYVNDSKNVDIRSIVIAQDVDIEPRIEIDIEAIPEASDAWYSELYAEEEHNNQHVWIEVVE